MVCYLNVCRFFLNCLSIHGDFIQMYEHNPTLSLQSELLLVVYAYRPYLNQIKLSIVSQISPHFEDSH